MDTMSKVEESKRAAQRCKSCGGSGFTYAPYAIPRGYACMTCHTIKLERKVRDFKRAPDGHVLEGDED